MSRSFAFVCLLLAAPLVAAASGDTDLHVDVPASGDPTGAPGLDLLAYERGENATWNVRFDASYTTITFRVAGFDVERAQQVVPFLRIDGADPGCAKGACEYTIFEPVRGPDVWNVEAPARIANVTSENDTVVVRVGVPGPVNATLSLVRDLQPPRLTAGPRLNLTPHGFYQETFTDELATVDLQVRRVGASDWIQSPTPMFHFKQRFPIQGLDPDTDYEQRFVSTDYAGNVAISETSTFRTPVAPVVPGPAIAPLEPAPNATIPRGEVTIRARVEGNETTLAPNGIRLFFDKRAITSGLVFEDNELRWAAGNLTAGPHSVSVEATSAEGGTSVARWTFEVGGAAATPGAGLAALALCVLAAALLARLRSARGP